MMDTGNIRKFFLILVLLSTGIIILWCNFGEKYMFAPGYSLKKCLSKGEKEKYLIFPEKHECVYILANSKYCQDGLPVPKILKPGFIFVHVDKIPMGKWWDHLLDLVPNIVIIKTTKVTKVFDKPVKIVQHQADVMRIQILLEFGGIYMDTDELALKSFDPLRKYFMTMGYCRADALGVQAIIASKNSVFLKIWYWTYNTFEDSSWAKNSQYMPYKLSKILPEFIHVERIASFAGFKGKVYDLFDRVTDWSKRYGLHLYIRLQRIKSSNPQHIKKLKSTYGQIARYIYYGKKDIIT